MRALSGSVRLSKLLVGTRPRGTQAGSRMPAWHPRPRLDSRGRGTQSHRHRPRPTYPHSATGGRAVPRSWAAGVLDRRPTGHGDLGLASSPRPALGDHGADHRGTGSWALVLRSQRPVGARDASLGKSCSIGSVRGDAFPTPCPKRCPELSNSDPLPSHSAARKRSYLRQKPCK
jgi:hypothetical protein